MVGSIAFVLFLFDLKGDLLNRLIVNLVGSYWNVVSLIRKQNKKHCQSLSLLRVQCGTI